jgi:hypothetical protein
MLIIVKPFDETNSLSHNYHMEREHSRSYIEEPPYFSNVDEQPGVDCPCGQYPYGDCEKCNSPEAAILRQREQLAQDRKNKPAASAVKPTEIPITDYLPYRRLKKKLESDK